MGDKIVYDIGHIASEAQECLDRKNYFAALALTLILPDICSKVEKREKTRGADYAEWCDIWLHDYLPSLIFPINGEEGWGKIIYKLRCGIMHNGEVDVSPRKYQLSSSTVVLFTLDDFNFYINTKRETSSAVVNVETQRTSGKLGYNCSHKIDIDIIYLIQAILGGVGHFITSQCMDISQFPTLEIEKE